MRTGRRVAAFPIGVGGVPIAGQVTLLALPPALVPVTHYAGTPGHLALAGRPDGAGHSGCPGGGCECEGAAGHEQAGPQQCYVLFQIDSSWLSLGAVVATTDAACQPPPRARYRATSLLSCCS